MIFIQRCKWIWLTKRRARMATIDDNEENSSASKDMVRNSVRERQRHCTYSMNSCFSMEPFLSRSSSAITWGRHVTYMSVYTRSTFYCTGFYPSSSLCTDLVCLLLVVRHPQNLEQWGNFIHVQGSYTSARKKISAHFLKKDRMQWDRITK